MNPELGARAVPEFDPVCDAHPDDTQVIFEGLQNIIAGLHAEPPFPVCHTTLLALSLGFAHKHPFDAFGVSCMQGPALALAVQSWADRGSCGWFMSDRERAAFAECLEIIKTAVVQAERYLDADDGQEVADVVH